MMEKHNEALRASIQWVFLRHGQEGLNNITSNPSRSSGSISVHQLALC